MPAPRYSTLGPLAGSRSRGIDDKLRGSLTRGADSGSYADGSFRNYGRASRAVCWLACARTLPTNSSTVCLTATS